MKQHITIGVLSPLLGGFYFGSLLNGVHAIARRHGARVIAIQALDAWVPHSEHAAPTAEYPMAWDHVDGWVVILQAANMRTVRHIKAAGKPIVTLSVTVPELDCPSVLPDNRGGTSAAVHHLIQHGHTRIGFAGHLGQEDIRQRYDGYRAALLEHGIEPDPALFFEAYDNLEVAGTQVGQKLAAAGLPCTAMVTGTDGNAIGIMEALHAAGYSLPQDLAIIGFDDIDGAQHTTPPLSTIRQKFDGLGNEAARLLFTMIDGHEVAPAPHYVETSFVMRESCGCKVSRLMQVPETEDLYATADWQEELARHMVGMAIHPKHLEPEIDPVELWPGVRTIIKSLAAAVDDGEPPSILSLRQAWHEVMGLTPHIETLFEIIKRLRRAGAAQLSARTNGASARTRLDEFLDQAGVEVARARLATETARSNYREQVVQNNYEINYSLLGAETAQVNNMDWLAWTSARWCCIGLWNKHRAEGPMQLELAGTYSRTGAPLGELKSSYSPQQFPPSELLGVVEPASHDMVSIIPLRTLRHDWGVIALVGPIEAGLSTGRETMAQWAALLSVALDREALLRSLEEQQAILRAMNNDLGTAKRAAEEANRLKTQFLANMSHELRTPLNSIINFAKLIGRENFGTLSDTQRDFQRRIVDNGEHLLGLINDILDLAKIEAGRMELFCEEIPLQPLLHGVMSTAIGLTKDKGLDLTLEVPEDLPPVMIDKTRVRQVLLNLLSNAAKFTNEGSITLTAERHERMVLIAVRDTGIGIGAEHHTLVFEEFRQVQGDLTREYQGTGLGLPICKRLVEMHGGTMWLASTSGEGSTFFFTLPIVRAYLPEEEELPPHEEARSANGPLIVVVDDDQNSQQILRAYLESNGCQVHSVLDSRRALETIRQIKPQLVILDVMMPFYDGWEVLALLKSNAETYAVPVIMCSFSDQERLGAALGADAYLVKPVREDEIMGLVRHWAKKEGTVLVVDDDKNARHVMRSMLHNTGYQIREAANGTEALASVAEQLPDLLILDLMMPEVDGFEVLSQLRADPRYAELPIIIVTAKDLSFEERRWLLERSQVCIQKSTLTQDEFINYVRRCIASNASGPTYTA
jgi:signal transduction histidine kinase/DNA-binding LacI/PurR family transcriptional regulator/CheY-like chemotaxis protein